MTQPQQKAKLLGLRFMKRIKMKKLLAVLRYRVIVTTTREIALKKYEASFMLLYRAACPCWCTHHNTAGANFANH